MRSQRRHDIVIEGSGNLQVSRKQDTYHLEIEEEKMLKKIDVSRGKKKEKHQVV